MPTLPTIDDLEAAALALEDIGDREARRTLLAGALARDDRHAVIAALAGRLPGPAFLTLFLSALDELAMLDGADFAALYEQADDQAAQHLTHFLTLVGGLHGAPLRALVADTPAVTSHPAFAKALSGEPPEGDEPMRLQVYAGLADIEVDDIHRFRERLARR